MSDIALKTHVAVFTDNDHVILRVGKVDAEMPYAAAMKMAQSIRVAGKSCARYSHEATPWLELAYGEEVVVQDYSKTTPSANKLSGRYNWSVSVESERITLVLGDFSFTAHYVDALKISQWMREAGKIAKLWAGDTSKSMSAVGMLTDAEENYRLGVN